MSVSENFKERIKTLKEHIKPLHIIVFSLCAFVAALSVAIYQHKRAESYRTRLDNHYLCAVSELSSFVQNIEHNLAKGMIATDSAEMGKIANDIYSHAAFASSALGQLPSFDGSISTTAEFLSQLGDYTRNLSMQSAGGNKISDEEYSTLESFISYAESLSDSISNLIEDVYGRKIALSDMITSKPGEFEAKNAEFTSAIKETENHIESFPTLIYDGPFSDHLKEGESALLEGKNLISKEQAKDVVSNLMGKNFAGEISYIGENGGTLPTYNFSVKEKRGDKRIITVEVTKKGGAIALILDNRQPSESNITIDEAKKNAYSFLARYDFGKMQDTYYEIENGIAVINFAFCKGDVICYSDLVKVKVSLDNGEILGLECSGYISNHKERILPSFSHSDEEIKNKISPKAEALKISKCQIPTEGGGEKFCYEVLCKYKDKNFLVYLNCETLLQEEILLLITTENGMLTI